MFFSHSYGEKYNPSFLQISNDFKGDISWDGFQGVTLNGNYGDQFQQLAYWKSTLPIGEKQVLDLWLEYEKDDSVSIQLKVDLILSGSISEITESITFSENELNYPVYLENKYKDSSFFVSLFAKGKGSLQIIALHDRHSRKNYGTFLPGGLRKVTKKKKNPFSILIQWI